MPDPDRVDVRRATDPRELLDRCAALLDADPVSTNVVATAATAEVRRGERRSTHLWVEHAGEVVAVAMRTPGMPVALSACTGDEAAALADVLLATGEEVAGASGPAPAAWAFVHRWTSRTGREVSRAMAQGVYVCDQVVPAVGVAGRCAPATGSHAELVSGWFADFAAGTGMAPAPSHAVATTITEARLHLWLDGEDRPVSMATVRTSGVGMTRLGPVWTPASARRHGYATAITAAVTASVLARGHRAMLFTDLDNPTSNGIYQRVGYRRVGDAAMLLLA